MERQKRLNYFQENLQKNGKVGVINLACKGVCTRYPVVRKLSKVNTEDWYSKGRYCKTCSEYIAFMGIDGNKCLCCNRQVRAAPHVTADRKTKHQSINRI